MPTNALIAIGAGAVSALASVTLGSGAFVSVFVAYAAPLPLFLVGLSAGPRMAGIAATAGFVVAGLLAGAAGAGIYGLVHALPAWMVVRQSLLWTQGPRGQAIWYPPGAIVSWLTLLGAALFLGAAFALSGSGGMENEVREFLDQAFRGVAPELTETDRGTILGTIMPFFPAATGSSWVIMIVVNAVLAQAILAKSGRSLRPTPAYVDVRLADWTSWVLVATAALALLGPGDIEYIGRNLTVILAVPFLFLGLVVAHALARRMPYGTMMLAAFYLFLLVSGWAMLVVAGVGVVEQWIGLRHRMAGPDAGTEPDRSEES